MKNIVALLIINTSVTNLLPSYAFQVRTRPRLPLIAKRLGSDEILERVDVAESSYGLHNEHELRCPMTGYTEGFLCSVDPGIRIAHERDTIHNSGMIRQVAIAGSVAAAQQNPAIGKFCYHTTEALMERSQLPVDLPLNVLNDARLDGKWVLYAITSSVEERNTESDVYIIAPEMSEQVWRISVAYKAFINKPYFKVSKDGQLVQVTKDNTYDDLYSVLVGWQ